jgi:hypothetical protein
MDTEFPANTASRTTRNNASSENVTDSFVSADGDSHAPAAAAFHPSSDAATIGGVPRSNFYPQIHSSLSMSSYRVPILRCQQRKQHGRPLAAVATANSNSFATDYDVDIICTKTTDNMWQESA